MLVIILVSEYSNYTTKRVLKYQWEKANEKLEVAKEKDSFKYKNSKLKSGKWVSFIFNNQRFVKP